MDDEFVKSLTKELRDGFGLVSDRIDQLGLSLGDRIDQTNARLDQTNARLDQSNAKLEEHSVRLEEMSRAIGETNTRLDHAIVRLDQTSLSVELLRAEVNQKLDGVGAYLRSINGHILDHADKIARLDKRLNDFETGKGN
jgi:methyl-accepting chemotaxis protein